MDFFALNWFFIILVSSLLVAATGLLQKISLKSEEVNPITFSIYFQILVGIFSIPMSNFNSINIKWNASLIIALSLMVIFYAASGLVYYYCMKNIEFSQVKMLSSTNIVWVALGGYIFFNELISLNKILGILLIIAGIVIIYWRKNKLTGFGIYQVLMVLYSLITAFAAILDKYNLQYFPSSSLYMVLSFITPSLVTAAFFPKAFVSMFKLIRPNKQNLLIILSAALLYVSTALYFKVLQSGIKISSALPVFQSSIIFSVLFGILFLKENDNWTKKIAGSIVVFAGVYILKTAI